jgi:hypothetical protein
MDSLFDDKSYEVGNEIEAYCPNPRCRGDTVHVINSMYESEIRKVTCTVCNDGHAFRKPRGIPFDAAETAAPKVSKIKKKPSWEEAMAKVTEAELAACRPYSTLDTYVLLDVVSHPTFGVGFVTELLPDNKIEISFKEERKILVHRRAAGQFNRTVSVMPAPRQRQRRKRRKKKGPDTADIAQRLLSERMLANTKSKNFAQVSDAKREAAEKAAEMNRRLALEIVADKMAKGVELTPAEKLAAKDATKLAKEEAKRRAAEEREKVRLEREKEREKARLEREKEREKERVRKEKERAKDRARKEREKEKLRKQREKARERKEREQAREQARKEREKEKLRKLRERERARKERERSKKKLAAERARKQREAARRKAASERARKNAKSSAASARRTGGKKTTTAIRRTGGKKTIKSRRG